MVMSRVPNTNVRFKDTRGAGVITVAGFELVPDKDGWIEAPPSFEGAIAPHGFLRENSLALQAWAAQQQKAEKRG